MDVNAAFPSKYLKAADIGEAKPTVVIDRVQMEAVGREQEQRPVVYFTGKSKGVVLNKTNAKAIAQIAGTAETDDWSGVRVQLFVSMVDYGGESVEAIRVRAPKPASAPAPKPQPEPEPGVDEDPIPF